MRSVGLLALVPLALGLLYAGAATLLSRRPDLAGMVPDDAVVVWRFRNLDVYDALRTAPSEGGSAPAAPASAVLGAESNLPGLPGIDRRRPMLEMTLDPGRRADPRYHVLPVEDAAAVRKSFSDPELAERHARHVAVHGAWAAVGWSAYDVRRAGSGAGLYPADRGEDWCVAADWERFVDTNLRPEFVRGDAVASVLRALGVDPAAVRVTPVGTGALVDVPGADRVLRLRHSWRTVTLYGWADRVRAELRPADDGELARVLAGAGARGAEVPAAPAHAEGTEASLSLYGPLGRRALVLALRDAGLAWPDAAEKDGFAALHLDAPGDLHLWSETAADGAASWVVGLFGPRGALPDLAAFGLPSAEPGGRAALAAGSAPLTAPYAATSPAGEVARRALPATEGLPAGDVVTLGPGAERAAERFTAAGASRREPGPPSDKAAGSADAGRVLASFRLSYTAAQRLLGKAISKSGLLSPLGGGDIEGTLSTDGRLLILEARRVAK